MRRAMQVVAPTVVLLLAGGGLARATSGPGPLGPVTVVVWVLAIAGLALVLAGGMVVLEAAIYRSAGPLDWSRAFLTSVLANAATLIGCLILIA